MSRRTQLATKFIFQILAQLSENFIFIYLGLSLFTQSGLEFKPLFILVSVFGICVARYCAVFPLSYIVNAVIRYQAKSKGKPIDEEMLLPRNHQLMLWWAGLRGAVGVALAAGLSGPNEYALRATILVVVVLTVIIFGGTTARMLEILQIRTGVVEEIDSDDEFDIEVVHSNGMYRRKSGGIGHNPRPSQNGGITLNVVNGDATSSRPRVNSRASLYSTGNIKGSPPVGPEFGLGRRNSGRKSRDPQNIAEQGGLLAQKDNVDLSEEDEDDLDLPPAARRLAPALTPNVVDSPYTPSAPYLPQDEQAEAAPRFSARGAINQILSGTSEDAASMFSRLDENFIKPHLLLDPGGSRSHTPAEDDR